MDRRDFLINSLGASALFLLKSSAPYTPETRFIIGDGKEKIIFHGLYSAATTTSASLFVAKANGDYFSIEAPCKAHEVLGHPINKNIVFCASKWSDSAFVADLDKKHLTKVVKADPNSAFYGHSLYSQNGQYLFMSMMDYNKDEGFISVREALSLKEIRRISTYGRIPHQIKWLEQDRLIAVINSIPLNNAPHLNSLFNIVNIHSGELVKSFATNEFGSTHFSFFANHEQVFIGRNIDPNNHLFFQNLNLNDGHITSLKDTPPRSVNKGECLSHIIIEEKNLVVMTLTGVNEIVIWDYKTNKIVSTFPTVDIPKGISLTADGKTISITYMSDENKYISLYHFDKFFTQALTPYAVIKGGSGSHLTLV